MFCFVLRLGSAARLVKVDLVILRDEPHSMPNTMPLLVAVHKCHKCHDDGKA